jgi:two-component system chemotaxis sensor kinase CheA
MTSDSSPDLARELLDDFYAECDEQLHVLRTLLAGTDKGTNTTSAIFEPLFRTMHSLKGNAAIVGLRESEELAHAAESFLKDLTKGTVKLSSAGLDVLLQTVHRLELTIGAHRQKSAIPAVADLIVRLKQFTASGSAANTPTQRPCTVYRLVFSPSKELDERGININSVRERLHALGKIVSSQPVIGGGTIAFEFIVELKEGSDCSGLQSSGIEITPFATAGHAAIASETTPAATASPVAQPLSDEGAALFIAPSHVVRVDTSRLDDLLRIAGELVIHRSRFDERLNHSAPDISALKEANLALGRSLRELREAITRVRLVPVAEVFARLPFVVRDLARESPKKARLVIEGQHTEIDKYLVERLKEPLLHLVRNAFSHGIESPDQRVAAGKPEEGTLLLSAAADGGFVVITIRDDGRGVDQARLVQRARSLHIPVPAVLDDKSVLDLLCTPGFSTREKTDRAAGRGVGMSVVKDVVQELGGNLSLQSIPSQSTQFTLRLPLSLSIVDALLLSVSGQLCAIPQNRIQEIIEVADADIHLIKQTPVMPYRDGVLPLVRLSKLFGDSSAAKLIKTVVVIRSDEGFAGLIVDRVISQREVVVRPMGDPLIQVCGIAGATELGDGRPVLILDALALIEGALRPLDATERSGVSLLSQRP